MIFSRALDRLLEAVGALGDFLLWIAALDRLHHAAHPIDRVEVRQRFLFEVVRQPLDEIRAAQRIDDVGHAGFVGDDLLRPQRQRRRFGGRQRERLVQRVRMERLRAGQHGASACSAVRTTLL